MDNGTIAQDFIDAFARADMAAMRTALAPGLIAWITAPDGGMLRVEGRDAYLGRIEAMDLPAARFTVTPTQSPVDVGSDLVMLMVEVRAERDGRSLHNFAGHLLRVEDGLIAEWWMVDAKPTESDAFWSEDASHPGPS